MARQGRWVCIIGMGLILARLVPGVGASPPAQTGQELVYGDSVSGAIAEDTPCQYYWFQGEAYDVVTIDMTRTAGNLDGMLALYRQDGADFTTDPLASDDDRPGGGLAPLVLATLPASDWCSITACRVQVENVRVTTGSFTLTLEGPDDDAPSGAGPGITGSLLNDQGATPTLPQPSPTLQTITEGILPGPATPTPDLPESPVATESGGDLPVLAYGGVVYGQLEPDQAQMEVRLDVNPGDWVQITWQAMTGSIPPCLSVSGPDGRLIAQSCTSNSVWQLQLLFIVPSTGTDAPEITLAVWRYGGEASGADGTFELRMQPVNQEAVVAGVWPTPTQVTPTVSPTVSPLVINTSTPSLMFPTQEALPTVQPLIIASVTPSVPIEALPAVPTATAIAPVVSSTPLAGAYPTGVCQSGIMALNGPFTTARLSSVYLASGDGYSVEEVTPTSVFRPDDDLNVVLISQMPRSVSATTRFCGPGGVVLDGGEGEILAGESYLLGVDWEYQSEPWPVGDWFVEIYVEGTLEVTLAFQVE